MPRTRPGKLGQRKVCGLGANLQRRRQRRRRPQNHYSGFARPRRSGTLDSRRSVRDYHDAKVFSCAPIPILTTYDLFFLVMPLYWKTYLLGFILFRALDIWKPFPARQLERLPGGWGIMADDWMAGIYAALVLRVALHFRVL